MELEIDIQSFRCFAAAASTLNFRAAAETLCMSPASLGQRIAKLETQMGGKLFERSTRRVTLTERGARALITVERFLNECQVVQEQLASSGMGGFSLTIATRFELGLSWLTPALETLSERQPERTLHLSFGDSDDMLKRVTEGRVDAAITSSRGRPQGTQVAELHKEEYVLVSAMEEQVRGETLLDIDRTLPLYRYYSDSPEYPDMDRFTGMEYLGTIGSIRLRVLEGAGIAVLPYYFVIKDIQEGRMQVLEPPNKLLSDAFRLIWLADHPASNRIMELAGHLAGIPLH